MGRLLLTLIFLKKTFPLCGQLFPSLAKYLIEISFLFLLARVGAGQGCFRYNVWPVEEGCRRRGAEAATSKAAGARQRGRGGRRDIRERGRVLLGEGRGAGRRGRLGESSAWQGVLVCDCGFECRLLLKGGLAIPDAEVTFCRIWVLLLVSVLREPL